METIAATTDIEQITIAFGSDSLLFFQGKQIARASSRAVARLISKSMGIECDRWVELKLFVTQDRTFVAQKIHCTIRDDEGPTYEGRICLDLNEVAEFFGKDDWLTQELFEDCGIDLTI